MPDGVGDLREGGQALAPYQLLLRFLKQGIGPGQGQLAVALVLEHLVEGPDHRAKFVAAVQPDRPPLAGLGGAMDRRQQQAERPADDQAKADGRGQHREQERQRHHRQGKRNLEALGGAQLHVAEPHLEHASVFLAHR